MEELNYHKLLNLRKRFDKYNDCPAKQELVSVIDKYIVIEKQISKEKDTQRRIEYADEIIECPYDGCRKNVKRKSLYKHKSICAFRPPEEKVKDNSNDELTEYYCNLITDHLSKV